MVQKTLADNIRANDKLFNGEISNVMIYDRCLSGWEIHGVNRYFIYKYKMHRGFGFYCKEVMYFAYCAYSWIRNLPKRLRRLT